jgi:hypothetical protein
MTELKSEIKECRGDIFHLRNVMWFLMSPKAAIVQQDVTILSAWVWRSYIFCIFSKIWSNTVNN